MSYFDSLKIQLSVILSIDCMDMKKTSIKKGDKSCASFFHLNTKKIRWRQLKDFDERANLRRNLRFL